jgi:hypothetical protein
MSAQLQFEREEEDIQRRYAVGEITNAEMWAEQKELQRDYRAAAEEAIREAGERERDNW